MRFFLTSGTYNTFSSLASFPEVIFSTTVPVHLILEVNPLPMYIFSPFLFRVNSTKESLLSYIWQIGLVSNHHSTRFESITLASLTTAKKTNFGYILCDSVNSIGLNHVGFLKQPTLRGLMSHYAIVEPFSDEIHFFGTIACHSKLSFRSYCLHALLEILFEFHQVCYRHNFIGSTSIFPFCLLVVFLNVESDNQIFHRHLFPFVLEIILEIVPFRWEFLNDCGHLERFTHLHPFVIHSMDQ